MKKFVLFLLPTAAAVVLYAATDFNAEGNRWWSHIQTLANDDMKGRNTGSPEHLKAAHYVAGEFERYGLKPAGTSGYFPPGEVDVEEIQEGAIRLGLGGGWYVGLFPAGEVRREADRGGAIQSGAGAQREKATAGFGRRCHTEPA